MQPQRHVLATAFRTPPQVRREIIVQGAVIAPEVRSFITLYDEANAFLNKFSMDRSFHI